MVTNITCPECEAEFSLNYDDAATEGEITYCPFCGEKLYLKDQIPPTWARGHGDDDDGDL